MLLIHVFMESWFKNIWFLNFKRNLLLFRLLIMQFFFIELRKRIFLMFILLMEAVLKVLFVIILIRGDFVSLAIVVNIAWRGVDGGTVVFGGWRLKSVSQHCLVHLIFYYIPALLPLLSILRWYYLFEAFRYFVGLFRRIIFLFILLNN